jgi:hypothetical protein
MPKRLDLPVAVLDPWAFSPRTCSMGTHVFVGFPISRNEAVDGRVEPGQGGQRAAFRAGR